MVFCMHPAAPSQKGVLTFSLRKQGLNQESKLHLYVITDSQLAYFCMPRQLFLIRLLGLFLFLYDTPFSTTGLGNTGDLLSTIYQLLPIFLLKASRPCFRPGHTKCLSGDETIGIARESIHCVLYMLLLVNIQGSLHCKQTGTIILQLPVVYEREFTTMEDKKHLEIRSGEYNLN